MKKKVAISLLVIASTITVGKLVTTPPSDISSAQEITQTEQVAAPEYAKWGKVAMQNVMSKYPEANVIDYLHVGKEVGSTTSVEKFKLWLKEGEREFGVFVDITFNNQTDEIVNIEYTETNQ